MNNTELPLLLLIADDLMFPSKVREGIRPLAYQLRVVATEDAAWQAATDSNPIAILINLTARRYDPLTIIKRLKDNPNTAKIPLLAFAGHVEREKHDAARTAGANMVAANSSVALHLAVLLKKLLAEPTESHHDVIEIEG